MKIIKSSISIILSLLMLISVFGVVPFTANAERTGDFNYSILDDGTAEINFYFGQASELDIPSELDGKKVSSIDDWAFYDSEGSKNLKKITIPGSVEKIGNYVFFGCISLENIIVDNSNNFFSDLDGNLYNKDKTEFIQYALGKADTNFVIPDSVNSIRKGAFEAETHNTVSLKSVTVPKSVTVIGEYALGYESNTDVQSVIDDFIIYGYKNSEAETYAFENAIDIIDIETGKPMNHFFYKVLEDGTAEITGYKGSYSEINIPSELDGKLVTSIGEEAFYLDDDYDSKITIPNTVKTIGTSAFYGFRNSYIIIPESVEKIGDKAFGYYYKQDFGEYNSGMILIGADKSEAQKYAEKNDLYFCGISVLSNISETINVNIDETIAFGNSDDIECSAFLNEDIASFRISLLNRDIAIKGLDAGTTKLIVKYKNNPDYFIYEIKVVDPNASEVTEPDAPPITTDPVVTTPDATQPVVTEPVVTTPNVTETTQPAPSKPSITTKKDNPVKVSAKVKTIKAKKLKKKAQKVKAITVKDNQGKVTYKLVKSGITKKIRKLVKMNSKGVITIKKWKKAKKGTYKIKVQITAAGNSQYNAKTIIKVVKVKVK